MSQNDCLIMRGYAILFIVLHNFCHLDGFGLPLENEMLYYPDRWNIFIEHLIHNPSLVFYDFFSFIGWIGVPLFVFLSGYGLKKKYGEKSINRWLYIKHSWVKLFLMILPGVLFLLVMHIYEENWWIISRKLFSLTLMNNLISEFGGSFARSFAPPYWYVGMTFQLYLFFLLLYKRKSSNLFVILMFLPFIIQFCLNQDSEIHVSVLQYLRRNCFAWIPVFYLGIFVARNEKYFNIKMNIISVFFLLLMSLIAVLFANAFYTLWVLLPYFSILLFVSFAQLTKLSARISDCMVYFGRMSMYLFLSHPIAIYFKELFCPPPYVYA